VLAAALKLRGFEVALLEHPDSVGNIEPVMARGGIKIRGILGEGLAEIDTVTTDAQEGLANASLVFVCVNASEQQRTAELMSPYLTDEQIVLLMPGNGGGALAFVQMIKESETDQRPVVAEASSFLLAGKKDGPDGVWVRGLKTGLPVAAFPGKETKRVVEALKETFSEFKAARHVLETSLTAVNHVIHPPGMLLNVGRLELAKEDWFFYSEGLSPAVCRTMEAIDRERVEIVTKLDLPPITMLEWLLQFYGQQGMKGDNLFEALNKSPVHGPSKAPRSIDQRYITDDIPFGLVPMASIGRELGVETPAIDTLIALASIVSDRDWWAEGRTADKMGLAGMSASQMIEYVMEGEL